MIPPSVRPRLHAYLATVLDGMGHVSLQVGGTGDHIHAFFALSRTVTLADTIQEMKTSSSKWMKEQMR
jgi:putative transposase